MQGRFDGKPEGKGLLQRRSCRLEDNDKFNLKGVEWECVDCIHLAEDVDEVWTVVSTVMYFWCQREVNYSTN